MNTTDGQTSINSSEQKRIGWTGARKGAGSHVLSDSDTEDDRGVAEPLLSRYPRKELSAPSHYPTEAYSDGDGRLSNHSGVQYSAMPISRQSSAQSRGKKGSSAFSRLISSVGHNRDAKMHLLLDQTRNTSKASMKQKLPPKHLAKPTRTSRSAGRTSDRRSEAERQVIHQSEKWKERVGCYCVAYPIPLDELKAFFETKGRTAEVEDDEVLHEAQEGGKDIFYFSFGSIVMWGCTKEEEKVIFSEVQKIAEKASEDDNSLEDIISSLSKDTPDGEGAEENVDTDEMDEHDFIYFDPHAPLRYTTEEPETEEVETNRKVEFRRIPTIVKGVLVLDVDLDEKEMMFRKLAFSFGLAQSVKLQVFEASIARVMDATLSLPQSLVQKGTIDLSKKEVSQVLGRIFIERNSVSLHADVLDTPDFFWDREELEPIYAKTCKYLDMEQRVSVLNSRLDLLKELFDMLRDELESKHSTRLEWIVIWLIVIEIVLGLFEMLVDLNILKPLP